MTNRLLWLLSYIGLSLALALGNRQTSATEGAPRALGAAEARPRGLGHSWLVYDKRAGPEAGMLPADRVLLIDDVLSTVNSYLRQQQRHHQELEAAQRNRNAAAAGYLYDEDEDELDDELAAAEEELQQPRRPAGRTFAVPAALYAEGLTRPRPGSSARGLPYQASPPPPAPPAAPPSEKPPGKRNQQAAKEAQQQAAAAATAAGASMASQFLRSARGNRNFDVPQIECPHSDDGMERFACPTADRMGRYRCIDDHVLCDGFIDCPTGEDEDRQACMFYKTTKAHLDVLADALLRWARGR